jgi:3-oxoacyl-[acyl-carrier-protein] synthase-1
VGSAVYHLEIDARRRGAVEEWLGFLAAQAFRDLRQNAALEVGGTIGSHLGVFLALPSIADRGPDARRDITVHFHNHAQQDLLPHFEVAFGDRTLALALAEEAVAQIRDGRLSLAAVGGVDSYFFTERLRSLDDDWRILSERNPDGFQPGEAASFFLLETQRGAASRGLAPLATMGGFGSARSSRAPGVPNTGSELSTLLDRILPGTGARPVVLCDLNGESARTREWGYALSRLGPRLGDDLALEHPASVLGDVGAATGATLVALATQYLGTKYTDRPGALVWAASDDGERRAVLLERA